MNEAVAGGRATEAADTTSRAKLAWLQGAALAAAALYVLLVRLDATPYDDSFFFKRVALHALQGHGFSWNVADGPVYGLTSQLFGLVTTALTWLFPSHFVLASKVFLAASVLLAGVTLLRFAARRGLPQSDAGLIVFLTLGTPLALLEPHTGMETSVCLAVLAFALTAIVESVDQAPRSALCAALTALVYACRPDAALLPALSFVVAQRDNPRVLLRYCAVLGAVLAAFLGACWLYYGTALPLPFYAKTAGLSAYDSELRALGQLDKVRHLLTFAAFAAPLTWVAVRGRGARGARGSPVSALLLASAAFIAYQALITDEIMGYRARFYVPALVPLALAATIGWRRCREGTSARAAGTAWLVWAALVGIAYAAGLVERGRDSALDRVSIAAYGLQLFLGVLLLARVSRSEGLSTRAAGCASIAVLLVGTALLGPPPLAARAGAALDDDTFLHRASAEVTTTRGLFEVQRCLPGAHTLYHSEIGIPGLVLPDWRVVDLVGLMSNELARHRPPFDAYCLRDRPEVLFLPHKAYRALNTEIRASACLRGYTLAVRESSSPLYVRSDLSDAFNACRRDAWRTK